MTMEITNCEQYVLAELDCEQRRRRRALARSRRNNLYLKSIGRCR